MTCVRYSKPATISSILEEVSDILQGSGYRKTDRNIQHTTFPRFDIAESDTMYVIVGDVAGVEEQQLSVSVEKDKLQITGTKKASQFEEQFKVLVQERTYGEFKREFKLPEDADAQKVDAHLSKGVLRIEIAKKEAAVAKKIAINVV